MKLTATASSATGDAPSSNNSDVENTIVTNPCANTTPLDLQPSNGATVPSNGTLSWSGTGSSYIIYLGPAGRPLLWSSAPPRHSFEYAGCRKRYEWRHQV